MTHLRAGIHRLLRLALAAQMLALCLLFTIEVAPGATPQAEATPEPAARAATAVSGQPPPPLYIAGESKLQVATAKEPLVNGLFTGRVVKLAFVSLLAAVATAWIFKRPRRRRPTYNVETVCFWTSGRVVAYDRQANRLLCVYLAEVPVGFALQIRPLRALDAPCETALAHVMPTSESGAVLYWQEPVGEVVQPMQPGCRYDITEFVALVFEPAWYRR